MESKGVDGSGWSVSVGGLHSDQQLTAAFFSHDFSFKDGNVGQSVRPAL